MILSPQRTLLALQSEDTAHMYQSYSVYIKFHIPAGICNVCCPWVDSILQCLFTIIGAWTAIFKLVFHVRRLKLKLNLICCRIQILRIMAGKKRNVSHFNYPLTVLPAHPPPTIPLTKMPLVELTVSRADKSLHWRLMTKGLGGCLLYIFVQNNRK